MERKGHTIHKEPRCFDREGHTKILNLGSIKLAAAGYDRKNMSTCFVVFVGRDGM